MSWVSNSDICSGPSSAARFGDRRGAQRGDPPEIGCGVGIVVEFTQRVDAGGGDHAAIAHQHQLVEPEACRWITGTISVNASGSAVLPGNTRTATGRPSGSVRMPVFDLLAAFLAVAGVAARGQLTAPPGHPGGGQVEQRHPARIHLGPQVFGGELAFDGVLAAHQPVHRGVDLVGGGAGHIQINAQGAIGPPSQGGQLAGGPHHPGDDQRQHQIACPARRPQQAGQAQLVRHRRDRRHVSVRQRAGDGAQRVGGHQRLTLQCRLDHRDHLGGQFGQVGQGLVADLLAVPIGAPYQHRLVAAHVARLVHIPARCPGYMHSCRFSHNRILQAELGTMNQRHTGFTGYTSSVETNPDPSSTTNSPYLSRRNFGVAGLRALRFTQPPCAGNEWSHCEGASVVGRNSDAGSSKTRPDTSRGGYSRTASRQVRPTSVRRARRAGFMRFSQRRIQIGRTVCAVVGCGTRVDVVSAPSNCRVPGRSYAQTRVNCATPGNTADSLSLGVARTARACLHSRLANIA